MALSDIYMVRDIQDYQEEPLMNVYFFQDITTAITAESVVTAYIEDFLPAVRAIQTADVTHTKVDAVNLADAGNFFESVIALDGSHAGESLPAHSAVNYSLRINSRALRPGSKRYCGIDESLVSGNLITNATYIGLLNTLRSQQSALIGEGIAENLKQIVVKRVLYEVPDSSPVRMAYRLPLTDEKLVTGDVVDALLNLKISHQVSRGNGRG